jgi:hypothetical protein
MNWVTLRSSDGLSRQMSNDEKNKRPWRNVIAFRRTHALRQNPFMFRAWSGLLPIAESFGRDNKQIRGIPQAKSAGLIGFDPF